MRPHLFQAFRERAFVFLWIGEVLTQVSVNFFTIYLILTTFPLTHSNTAVSGVVLTFTFPAIIFGILAGAYVDHWNKKNVLLITNILRAVFILILAFLRTDLIIIYSVSLIVSFLTQFFVPAETPIIPQIVKKEHLYSANALFSLAIQASILLAYMFSGSILLIVGPQISLILFAVLLLLSSVSILFVTYTPRPQEKKSVYLQQLNIHKEIKSAFALMAKTRKIYSSLFFLALTQTLVLVLAALTPGYATQVLHINVDTFPLRFVTPAVIGMAVGAIILVHYFSHVPKNKIVTIGLFLSGISMMLLPFGGVISSKEFVQDVNVWLPHILSITSWHLVVVLAFLLGLANSLVFVPSNTLLQESTNDENRGKLYGILNAVVGIFSLVPVIAVGGLADLLGISNVIVGIGVCLVAIGGYEYAFHKLQKD